MKHDTYARMRELEDSHWWFVARRDIIRTVIRTLGLPEPARLLEVGCGTGGNIAMLGRFGVLTCIESDAGAAEFARTRSAAPVLAGSLPDALPPFETGFDLVLALDVIEHVERDREALVALARLLQPGARLLLTVPAFPFLWSRHDEESHHFRRYRKRDLRRLAREAGLDTVYASYFNFWLFPLVAAVRVARKVFPYRETWQDMRQPPDAVNGLLRRVFASERLALRRRIALPFGVSLLAVLRRPSAAADAGTPGPA